MIPLWIKFGVVVSLTLMAFGQYFAFRNARGKGFSDAAIWGFAWPYLITYCWWHKHELTLYRIPKSAYGTMIGRCVHCKNVICFFPNGTDLFPPGMAIKINEENHEFAKGFLAVHGVTIQQALREQDVVGSVHTRQGH